MAANWGLYHPPRASGVAFGDQLCLSASPIMPKLPWDKRVQARAGVGVGGRRQRRLVVPGIGSPDAHGTD